MPIESHYHRHHNHYTKSISNKIHLINQYFSEFGISRFFRKFFMISRMRLLVFAAFWVLLSLHIWSPVMSSPTSILNQFGMNTNESKALYEADPNKKDAEFIGNEALGSNFALGQVRKLYLESGDSSFNVFRFQDDMLITKPGRQFPPVRHLPQKLKKRILVTGGAGFVGSHLVDRLMMMGHEVTVLDNFFTGNRRNVRHWFGHPNFELVRHDVVDPFMMEVDEIYHLACPASPPHYQYNPIKTVKTSVMGTINMLGLAKRVKARFLLTSTSEVYGDPEEHPQKESYWGHVNPIGPRACYDEGKRVAETLTYAYCKQDDVQVRVARIFNTFGPRMNENDGRVVSNFIMQSLKGDDLTVYGEGDQTRSFQYVHDLVDGLIALMASNYSNPVNLGNPDEYTIKNFAEMIRDEVNKETKITHLPATTDDPQKRRPDISVAKQQLDWEPRFPVKQGIRETVEYFRKYIAENCKDDKSC